MFCCVFHSQFSSQSQHDLTIYFTFTNAPTPYSHAHSSTLISTNSRMNCCVYQTTEKII